jgi:hypothetical protein
LSSKSSRVRAVRLNPLEEQAILQITQELISRLEVHDLIPKKVIVGKTLKLEKNRVILPLTLYNKLTPDEWRPLIASNLIYHCNFNKKKKLLAYSYQLFPYLMIPPFVIASSILGIIPVDRTVNAGTFLLWVLAMFVVAKVVYAPFFRRLQQTADKATLELFVNPSLEDVLRKVEMMNTQRSKGSKVIEKRIKAFREPT